MVSASLTTLVCIWSFILQPITWCRRRSNIDQPGQFSVGGNKHWFNLADMACEEALYNSVSLRGFVGIDLGCGPVPDSTTITKFRKLINDNKLGEALFPKVGKELQERGFKLNTGIIIAAASSTENVNKARDPEVHQTKAEGQRLSAGAPGHPTCRSAARAASGATCRCTRIHGTWCHLLDGCWPRIRHLRAPVSSGQPPRTRGTRAPADAGRHLFRGCEKVLGLHALRTTAATCALDNQADIAKVQEWLGHANTSTTRVYDRRETWASDSPTFSIKY